MTLRLLAPAKVNWTLEVLGKRDDGYHEVRTVLQAVDLADSVTLSTTDTIALAITGDASTLPQEPVEQNLAYRAAALLRGASSRGVRIDLDKRVPVAAGLGGGSSDAAAVLRGLRRLWSLDISDAELASLAAGLGSDVPFFLHGGAALAYGRGDLIEPLPDVPDQMLVLAWNEDAQPGGKTGAMYAGLRPQHYTDGSSTAVLAERIRRGRPIRDEDVFNGFERVTTAVLKGIVPDHSTGTAHLCGSGPALFYLVPPSVDAASFARDIGSASKIQTAVARTLGSAATLAIEELP